MAKLFRKGGPTSGEIVEVEATPGVLRVATEDGGLLLPYERLRGRIGGYEDAWFIFECEGQAGLELWVEADFVRGEMAEQQESMQEPFASRFAALVGTHKRRGGTRWAVRAGLMVVFLGFVAWFFSGGLVVVALDAIPYSLETKLGDVAAEEFAGQHPTCDDPVLNDALSGMLERLVGQMEDVNYEYRVRILTADQVNAFALPGGEIFFYSGLLEEAETADEVAAVMGHEIQHAVMRHGLRGMLQSAGVRVLFMVILGGASDGIQILGGYAGKLGQLKFGRDQERQADELGVALMARSGYDPQGAVDFFGRLADSKGDTGSGVDRAAAMVSTHPASSERQDRLRALAAELGTGATDSIGQDWQKVRARCSHLEQGD
jgi:beta-barrel assembly-enhancing protease